jgi:MYXO-CTERM domain-containing protein
VQRIVSKVAIGSLISLVASAALAGDPSEPASIHQQESLAHAHETAGPRVLPDEVPPRRSASERVVYGYYPFWVADLTTIRWEALTHLAWFSIDLDGQGQIVSKHGWPDQEVVDTAHAAGVRVDLTFTLFGGGAIETLCNSPTRRAETIATILSEVQAGGADGVSIDFEFVNGNTREGFVSFIEELRAALNDAGRDDAEISIAGPTVDWSNGLDMNALLDAADWFFVMGYGYFWSGSSQAGPTGMMRVTPEWAGVQSLSMLRTIATYSAILPAERRRQLIWGVPYYGREWVTASPDHGASVISQNGAVTYSAARSDLAEGGVEELYDEGIENPWYRWQQGGSWRQVYYDDERSLAAKYDLAFAQGLGGVGMWALNYDAPHAELWDLLEATLNASDPLPEGHRDAPLPIDAFPFHDERDTTDGPSHYFNHYACDAEVPEYGREWVYRVDVCQPGTLLASVPEYPDRDPDLHLLSAPDQDACLARAHTDLETAVEPGRYLLVVDTFVDLPIEMEGAYELDVDFVPQPGSQGCAQHLVCDAGACVCPDPATTSCGADCVELMNDDDHCGACDAACGTGERCVAGECEATNDPEVVVEPSPPTSSSAPDAGCGCETAGGSSEGSWAWLALLGVAGWRRQRATRSMLSTSAASRDCS